MKIGLIDLLKVAGFSADKPTKVVRHQDGRNSIQVLRQNNWLEQYQAYQAKPLFHKALQVVSFYGLPGTRAGFYGMYEVLGYLPASEGHRIPEGQNWGQGCKFFYKLRRDPTFDSFRDRLIVDWGSGAINWAQWLSKQRDKEVLEILAPGRKLPTFIDFMKFSLSYSDLKELFRNEEAHRDWMNPLRSVAGIYLILAETTGKMYIGSAYGTSGIWGRWRKYIPEGHGNNKQLMELIDNDPSYPASFRFSVLQVLPISTSDKEVVQWERLFKQKLGTQATGLNSN